MRVLILGMDGYLGWSLTKHLSHVHSDWDLCGVDCYKRRDWVAGVGGQSATPIARMTQRLEALADSYGRTVRYHRGDVTDYDFLVEVLRSFRPDAIVHLAEMPSAPYSMMGPRQACETHRNNVEGTLNLLFAMRDHVPEAHLVKLGTMGEYGTPAVDIPEGEFELDYKGRKDHVLFPRKPGSFYHATKVHDTHNTRLACRAWGLAATDVMQGVVYGLRCEHEEGKPWDPALCTRFDFDAVFGTVINRFCAQAVIGEPLTVYGSGAQRRGFLPLKDSMRCLTLAMEFRAQPGTYRTFNQFEQVVSLNFLAKVVEEERSTLLDRVSSAEPRVVHLENPREGGEVSGRHYYNPECSALRELGYEPTKDLRGVVRALMKDLTRMRHRIRARAHALKPDVHWDGARREAEVDAQRRLGDV